MISADKIIQAIKLIAAFCNISAIRAEQNGDRPERPFMTYKVLGQSPEPVHLEIVSNTPKEGDETKAIVTSEREEKCTVSISFFGDDFNEIWQLAEKSRDYLESEAGKEALFGLEIFPRILSPDVNDRTSFMENAYEYRIGYDVRFEGKRKTVSETDALDMAATVADIQV